MPFNYMNIVFAQKNIYIYNFAPTGCLIGISNISTLLLSAQRACYNVITLKFG